MKKYMKGVMMDMDDYIQHRLSQPVKPTSIALHPDQKRALEEQAKAAEHRQRMELTHNATKLDKIYRQFLKNIERGIQYDIQ